MRLEGWPLALPRLWPSFETPTFGRLLRTRLMDDIDMIRTSKSLYTSIVGDTSDKPAQRTYACSARTISSSMRRACICAASAAMWMRPSIEPPLRCFCCASSIALSSRKVLYEPS
jgi:hypothetical protein